MAVLPVGLVSEKLSGLAWEGLKQVKDGGFLIQVCCQRRKLLQEIQAHQGQLMLLVGLKRRLYNYHDDMIMIVLGEIPSDFVPANFVEIFSSLSLSIQQETKDSPVGFFGNQAVGNWFSSNPSVGGYALLAKQLYCLDIWQKYAEVFPDAMNILAQAECSARLCGKRALEHLVCNANFPCDTVLHPSERQELFLKGIIMAAEEKLTQLSN